MSASEASRCVCQVSLKKRVGSMSVLFGWVSNVSVNLWRSACALKLCVKRLDGIVQIPPLLCYSCRHQGPRTHSALHLCSQNVCQLSRRRSGLFSRETGAAQQSTKHFRPACVLPDCIGRCGAFSMICLGCCCDAATVMKTCNRAFAIEGYAFLTLLT